MIREIVLDTETTGIDPEQGHRIVEIGCVELVNHVPSGKTLQLYINPERPMPAAAEAVHGLGDEFPRDKPVFSEVYSDFLAFIGEARLIIHNAPFDMKFINWELKNVGHPIIPMTKVLDTLDMARRKFPGSPASLDALCKRFGVDNTGRHYHGALLDSELLAEVYLELMGGRQHGLSLLAQNTSLSENVMLSPRDSKKRTLRVFEPSSEEKAAHEALLRRMNNPLWPMQS